MPSPKKMRRCAGFSLITSNECDTHFHVLRVPSIVKGSSFVSHINSVLSKYIEDIQIFGMNMPFISSSEARNAYFMSGEATNETYIFSLHEMK